MLKLYLQRNLLKRQVPFFEFEMIGMLSDDIKIHINCEKWQMMFFVFYSHVMIEVRDTNFSIEKGEMWQVQRGHFYSIANSYKNSAQVFFTSECKISVNSSVNIPEERTALLSVNSDEKNINSSDKDNEDSALFVHQHYISAKCKCEVIRSGKNKDKNKNENDREKDYENPQPTSKCNLSHHDIIKAHTKSFAAETAMSCYDADETGESWSSNWACDRFRDSALDFNVSLCLLVLL